MFRVPGLIEENQLEFLLYGLVLYVGCKGWDREGDGQGSVVHIFAVFT
jgi:hypothetical protein